MDPRDIQAIDVHAHYGVYFREKAPPIANEFASGDAACDSSQHPHDDCLAAVWSVTARRRGFSCGEC